MPDMIESSGKLIEEELAKAGTDPELIGRLKKDRITVDKELPPMEFLLKLFDVPCGASWWRSPARPRAARLSSCR